MRKRGPLILALCAVVTIGLSLFPFIVHSPRTMAALSVGSPFLSTHSRQASPHLPLRPILILMSAVNGTVTTVAASGTLAYVSLDTGSKDRIAVVDVSNARAPQVIATYSLRGTWPRATHIQVVDSLAYVTTEDVPTLIVKLGVLDILDVSVPSNPRSLGYFDGENYGGYSSLAVADPYAYLTIGGWKGREVHKLLIVDVHNPSLPQLQKAYGLGWGGSKDVAIRSTGNSPNQVRIAYLADRQDGLDIVDVSQPAAPTLMSSLAVSTPYAIRVVGDLAYIAAGDNGLQIVDVHSSSNPVALGHLETEGTAYDLEVVGQVAFVAAGEAGIEIADVSDPSEPRLVSRYDTPGRATQVRVSGDSLYVADSSGGLRIYRVLMVQGSAWLPLIER